MKKFLYYTLGIAVVSMLLYFLAVYYITYSEGYRAGELVKFSHKGVIFKTWEGEISQGISGAQIFSFSVLDKDKEIIENLNNFQGKYVKVDYVERYASFIFWGDTKYFITNVVEETSPHKRE